MTEEDAFKAGWAAGYSDGGEHDCRMFTPTADRAWRDYVFERIREKHGLEAATHWIKTHPEAKK